MRACVCVRARACVRVCVPCVCVCLSVRVSVYVCVNICVLPFAIVIKIMKPQERRTTIKKKKKKKGSERGGWRSGGLFYMQIINKIPYVGKGTARYSYTDLEYANKLVSKEKLFVKYVKEGRSESMDSSINDSR